MHNAYANVLMPRESEYIEEILDEEDSLEKIESKMKLVLTRRVSNNIVRYVYYLGSYIYLVEAQIYLLLGLRYIHCWGSDIPIVGAQIPIVWAQIYPLLGLRYTLLGLGYTHC